MKAKVLLALLGIAVLAVPAAVPASQPTDVRLGDLTPAAHVAVRPKAELALVLRSPYELDDSFAYELPKGDVTQDWALDPFAI